MKKPRLQKDNMKIITIISNYNEEEAIAATIQDILMNKSIETDILVIDNSSTDNSLQIVKELGVDYLIHPVNTGGSSGVIKTAFAYAYYHDYDIYCHMDGDNQHLASELIKIVDPLLKDKGIDIVTGSRYINKEGFQSTFMRKATIFFFSKIISLITKSNFTDITSGFIAYNNKAIKFFATNFKHEIESATQLQLIAYYAGLKRCDIPVVMKARSVGVSEFNIQNAIKFPIYNFISFIGTIIKRV